MLTSLVCFAAMRAEAQDKTLPAGFVETRVAAGLTDSTTMAIAPDGRIFVAQKTGALRVIRNGTLLAQPFVTVSVNDDGERGLLGVTFDPDFLNNGYVYIYYTAGTTPPRNRLQRFTASASNPDVAAAGSGIDLLTLPDLVHLSHNGGALHFGFDGKLYVAIGDNNTASNAQSMTTVKGKILRINADGSIPTDNPFYSQTTGINRSIWALGLRNPFTFAIDPVSGRMHINDVGNATWEEVNVGGAGANFGWPQTEGRNPPGVAGVTYPLYTYEHGPECAVTGAAFYRPQTPDFPSNYAGRYFFGDFCAGWMRTLLPPNYTTAASFATGITALVAIDIHPDGSLYYLDRGGGGNLYRVTFTGDIGAPNISAHPESITRGIGQVARFTVVASGTGPLTYRWQRNGVNIPNANSSSYTLTTSLADNGAQFRVVVSTSGGSTTSNSATLTVLNNYPPRGTITAPVDETLYRGGQTFTFSGTGTDTEDGTMPASAFTWRVDFYHNEHTHPFMPSTRGVMSGSFTIPTLGETSSNVFYRLFLTVKDSAGLNHTSWVDLLPRTSQIRLESNLDNAQLTLDGSPITAPATFTGVEGIIRSIGVVTPQTSGGQTQEFVSWSDGGAATHDISTPTADTTYTALFQRAATSTVYSDNFEAASGWTLTAAMNPATTGRWQRGDPQATSSGGITVQPGSCAGPSVNCLVTGLTAGTAVGANDVDGGLTSIQSPPIALPAGVNLTMSFQFFFAHLNNATSADFFRVRVIPANGPSQTVWARGGSAANVAGTWTTRSVNLSAWAGQTVRIRVDAADAGSGSLIEAGFDNVVITRQ